MRSTVFSFLLLLSFLFPSEWKFFEEVSFSRLVKELLNYQVIYVGEVHDSEEIHEIQLKVLKFLHQRCELPRIRDAELRGGLHRQSGALPHGRVHTAPTPAYLPEGR
ncbi:MAG: hypothetical protein DSY32_04030 [Aquifex sp.]|nr:MAG: hypothetical protein DSY32_04030 [Aquifex sp.]